MAQKVNALANTYLQNAAYTNARPDLSTSVARWLKDGTRGGTLGWTAKLNALMRNTYAKQITRETGLVGYWRMNAASGTVEADASGLGHTGAITGGVTLGQTGSIADGSQAQLLDGSTGFVKVTTASVFNITGAITLELWAKFTVTTSFGFLLSKSTGGADGYELFRNTGTGQIRFSAAAASVSTFDIVTGAAFNDGAWHHIVATYDPTTAQKAILYIDGVSTITSGTVSTLLTADASDLFLGARGAAGSLFFAGSMDEVAIYNVALSAAQVLAHYSLA